MAYIEERPSKTGKPSYRALIRMRGYPAVSGTFKRKTDALQWVQETESSMRQGRYFKSPESKKKTVSDLIERYLARVYKESPARHDNLKSMLEWWNKELGHCVLNNLSKALLSEKIEKLAATVRKHILQAMQQHGITATIWCLVQLNQKAKSSFYYIPSIEFVSSP